MLSFAIIQHMNATNQDAAEPDFGASTIPIRSPLIAFSCSIYTGHYQVLKVLAVS